MLEAFKKIGVTEQTYYRWKKKFGGLQIEQEIIEAVQAYRAERRG